MGKKTKKLHSLLGSNKFFWFIFGIFIFEASWIALSAIYPQAFDEDFHFGLIRVYSHYWLPFLTHQPPNADVYGAVARDPSFLYHYLMSFPYRFINLFVHGQVGQVIIFRFIDIGLIAWALLLFRRIFKRVGVSSQLSNLILFLFVLIPVVPQLAGQVSYDDLLIPLIALSCLLSFNVIDQIKAKTPNSKTLTWLLLVCLTATMVKIEFGPIFLGIILYLSYLTYKIYKSNFKHLFRGVAQSWKQQSKIWKIMVIVLFVFLASMFGERDAYNIYKYHSISPNCSQILTTKECSAYSIWSTDSKRHISIVENPSGLMNPIKYLGSWAYWMWYRLFFAVNGVNNFTNYPPLPLPIAASVIIFIAAIYSITRYWRKIFEHNRYLRFLALICGLYIAILIFEGYSSYRYTGALELMNGRYLLPIIIFLAAIFGTAFSIGLKSSVTKKLFFGILILVMFLEGGGLLTFIARSDNTWYWDNGAVVKVNQTAKKLTSKLVVKGRETYSTKDWFFN